ncbi:MULTISPECIES: thioredoxin family protein [Bacillus]|uniref:thioredoxin family protein n=1 Tax=Bacillus TaxID=1386 RepID=UPI001879FC5D|nr:MULTISPECIES: thioredoxin family protein [Bacillus cereus group]MBE7116702.1 thioredoxin family protein [Bacillus paranthracis]MBE7135333.1 thioredoxin family protein [Bacillus paranthracis]MBE7151922.1 thioredoxin family protein [Bacillus paranthracis]MCC2375562.1 thioredoxin family protein [Bacillus paranthracis]MCX3322846.1 thioredoxin family protein [Bacillus paranthracis]
MKKIIIFVIVTLFLFGAITFFINKEEKNYYTNNINTKQLQEDITNKKDKIIYFYQTNCSYCSKVSPVLIPMASEMDINLQTLNLEKHQNGWNDFKIEGTPTIIHYQNGKEIDRLVGDNKSEVFKEWLEKTKNSKDK